MMYHDIVIVGGGPAGMAAAVAAYDAGCTDVVILDRESDMGGILRQCIHAGFGLHKLGRELTGPEYADVYKQEVLKRGIQVCYESTVTAVSPEKVVTAQNRDGILKMQAKAVVLAMGCRERSRGALNTPGTRPAGVYSAGTAQKFVNCEGYMVGKTVVILGSGDIGLIMARRMTLENMEVKGVYEVMPSPGGLTRNIVQCLDDFGIPLHLSSTVAKIHGKKRLEGVTVAKLDENRNIIPGTEEYIECDLLVLAVGLIPENELSVGCGIELDPRTRGPVLDNHFMTSVPGIFACGNVAVVFDLVDYVSQSGEVAAQSAVDYIQGKLEPNPQYVQVKAAGNVNFIVPQRIVAGQETDVQLYLRVRHPDTGAKLECRQGEEVLKTAKHAFVAPPEMIACQVTAAFTGDLTVDMKEA